MKNRAVPQPDPEVLGHYDLGEERGRLGAGPGVLERLRTEALLERFLPPAPARILDVGGGPGGHACTLARQGYQVHLVDLVPLHVEQALEASAAQPDRPLAGARVGDARRLDDADDTYDAVLLAGPLYHLTERSDRVQALAEACRVVHRGGVVLAAGISRFASLLYGLLRDRLGDPVFASIVAADLASGQHRNPTRHPEYFTTAFFHHPEELAAEARDAGLAAPSVLAIEGPGWLLADLDATLADPARRALLLAALHAVEAEPSMLGSSAHLMLVARRPAE